MCHNAISIQHMKDFYNKWYMVISMVLVGAGGFLLGGLFVHSFSTPPQKAATVHLQPLPVEQSVDEQRVYASKRGKRYYPWWCEAGGAIAEENIVWFETPKLAQAVGYSIAKGCR